MTIVEDAQQDHNVAAEIERLVDEIVAAMDQEKPRRLIAGGKLRYVYNLVGLVQGLRLIVSFSFPRLASAHAAKLPGDVFWIDLPNSLFDKINKDVARSSTFLHHELTHVLLRHHDEFERYLKASEHGLKAYYNQPMEIDAFFQQAIARIRDRVRRGKLSPEIFSDQKTFAKVFERTLHFNLSTIDFCVNLSDENWRTLFDRVEDYRLRHISRA